MLNLVKNLAHSFVTMHAVQKICFVNKSSSREADRGTKIHTLKKNFSDKEHYNIFLKYTAINS